MSPERVLPQVVWRVRQLWAVLQAHPWLAIAIVALACRALLTLPALGDVTRFYITPDSFEYEQLALNLIQGHGYSQAGAPPYPPDVRRTPVYPLLLAAVYAVAGQQPWAAVTVNALLGVLACVLTAVAGTRLLGRDAGILAGMFLAVDLTSAAYSLTLMTETLFTVLLLLCLLSVIRYMYRPDGRAAALAAVWCGIAILTRPIGLFLPFVLGPTLGVLPHALSRRTRALGACMFALLALAFPLGWTVRNYLVAGVAQPTSLIALNAYYHRAAFVEAQRRGARVEDVRQEFAKEALTGGSQAPSEQPADLAAMQRKALQVLLADPAGYLALHIRGVARLLGPERDLLTQFRVGSPHAAGLPESVAEFVTAGSHAHTDTGSLALIVGTLQLLGFYALAVVGVVAGLRSSLEQRAILLLGIVALYFLAVSGPEAYARFRVPVMPFIVLLAAAGTQAVWGYLRSSGTRQARSWLGEHGRT